MRKHILISALVIMGLGALAIPSTAAARGGREVRLQDRCDPATFNAAIPSPPGAPPTCIPHGGQKTVTFAQFLAKLNPVDFGHEKWNNHPDELDLKSGDSISVVVRGGEYHTFTPVAEFGAGCVPLINGLLGLFGPTPSDADCDPAGTGLIVTTGVLPNGLSTLTVSDGLDVGTHKFMCLIHPWMRTVVTVEDDD